MTSAYIYIIVHNASFQPLLPAQFLLPSFCWLFFLSSHSVLSASFVTHRKMHLPPLFSFSLPLTHIYTEIWVLLQRKYPILHHSPAPSFSSPPLEASSLLTRPDIFILKLLLLNIIFYYSFENSPCTCDIFWSYLILTPSPNPTDIHPFLLPLPNFMSFFYIPPSPVWAAHILMYV